MNTIEFASFLNNAKWYDIERYVSTQEMPTWQQSMIFKHKDDLSLQAALAKNPHLCSEAQIAIAKRRNPDYDEARENLADNSTCCEAAQNLLVGDPDELVKCFLASNFNICERIAETLSKERSFNILSGLYINMNVPEKFKKTLRANKAFMSFLKREIL